VWNIKNSSIYIYNKKCYVFERYNKELVYNVFSFEKPAYQMAGFLFSIFLIFFGSIFINFLKAFSISPKEGSRLPE